MPRRRRGYRALALAGAFSVLAGCTQFGPAERESLTRAAELYSQSRIGEATARLDRLINDFGGAAEISEAYYLRGLCRTTKGDAPGASEDFKRAISNSKRDDLKARCQASLAALAYRRGDWSEAAKLYAEATPHLPDQPPTDEILYRAAVAMQRSGQWPEARQRFARILWKFRDRPIAAEARRMAGWRHDHYAIQLGAFRDAENGQKAEQSFRAKRLDAVRLENQPRDGYALWVVMAGRYPTYSDAVAALPRIRAIEPQAHVIPQP